MATFTLDAATEPTYLDIIDIAAGYGIFSTPMDGLFPGDLVQTMTLVVTDAITNEVALSKAIDISQRTQGYFEWVTQSSVSAHWTFTAADIATLQGGVYMYSCSAMIYRSSQTYTREYQGGSIAARPTVPLPPLLVNSVVITGGPIEGNPLDTFQLAAITYDGYGNVITGQTVIWSSSNAAIASVNQAGLVTLVTSGNAIITASCQGITATTTASCQTTPVVAVQGDILIYNATDDLFEAASPTVNHFLPATFGGDASSVYAFPGFATVASGLTVTAGGITVVAGTSALQSVTATTVTATTFTGALVGNASTATTAGNAATATALQTGRTINGVLFDGTANIVISAAADAGLLTGTTLAANVVTSSLTRIGTLVAGAVPASLVTAGTFAGNSATVYGFPGPVTLHGIQYTWPATQAAGLLKTDGAGVLSWGSELRSPLGTLTSTGTLVGVAPYPAVVSGAANFGPTTGETSLDFVNVGQTHRIRQNGTITRARVYLAATTGITALYLKVWRVNTAGTYDLVGLSANIGGALTGASINTLTLATGLPVLEGDYLGLSVTYSSASVQNFFASTIANTTLGQSGGVIYSVTNTTPGTSGYDWAAQTATPTSMVLLGVDMAAPIMVMIGDSVTSGLRGTCSFADNYTNIVSLGTSYPERLGAGMGYTIQNMGIGGQTSTQIAARFAADVVALAPRVVVIMAGINDINAGVLNTTIVANFTAMLDAAVAAGIIPVVIGTTPWRTGVGATNAKMQQQDALKALLQTLVTSAPYNGYYVDPASYLGLYYPGGDVGNLWQLQPAYDGGDGIHPNAFGYSALAQAVLDIIAPVQLRAQTTLVPQITVGAARSNPTRVTYAFGSDYAKTDTTLRAVGVLAQSNDTANPFQFNVGITGGATVTVRRIDLQTADQLLVNDGTLALQRLGGTVTIGAGGVTVSGAITALTTISTAGTVAIGGAPSSAFGLRVMMAMASAGPDGTGISGLVTQNSAVTGNGISMLAGVLTAASAFTMTNGIGVRINDAIKGAGSTITNQYGLYIDSQTQGGTLNYAIWTNTGLVRFGDAVTVAGALVASSSFSALSNVGIGIGSNTTTALRVVMALASAGVDGNGIQSACTFNSAVTGNGVGVLVGINTAAASFTMTNGIGVRINDAIKGAGSTITNQYGLYIDAQTQGGTLNYAIYTNAGLVRFGGGLTVATGGVTVSAGTTAVQALTATTGGFSGNVTVSSITSGTWTATAIAAGFGGTGLTTYAVGDMLYASATTPTIAKLTIGTSGQFLWVTGGLPAWRTLVAADVSDLASATVTFTNKRITKRTGTTASSATPTINTDNVDFYSLTAQSTAITSFTTNLSGTPTVGQTLWIAITDDGTARAIAWGTSFEASTVALPTTTVISTRLDVGFVWNSITSKWRCVASA